MISRAVALSCAAFLAQPRTLGECAREWGVKPQAVYADYIAVMRHGYRMNIVTLQRPRAETRYQLAQKPE